MEDPVIFNEFVALVFKGLGGLLLIGLNILAYQIYKKYGIEIDVNTKRMIREMAMEAVSFVEERAAEYANKKGAKIHPDSKKGQAIMYLREKVPSLTYQEAEEKITAALKMLGIGASGKTLSTKEKEE